MLIEILMTMLQGTGFKIRAWQSGDEPSLVKNANNKKLFINMRDRFPHPYTMKDAQEWIAIASVQNPLVNFAIEVDGQAVGGIGLVPGSDVFRQSAEIGYWLGESYWGKGIMSQAVRLITQHAFDKFDFIRLHAGVFDWNPASARVLEKAGYQFESRMKKSVVKEGQILDQLNYVALK
jgi:ribosomal-protein-alanine N-acetyltransferase